MNNNFDNSKFDYERFQHELERLINSCSLENELVNTLKNYGKTIKNRDKWYSLKGE